MKRLRHDIDHLTSAGLLLAAIAAALTGVIADLWDLNDFWYHTLAGYVMGAPLPSSMCGLTGASSSHTHASG